MADDEQGTISNLSLLSKADLDCAERFLHQLIDSISKQRGPQFKDFSNNWNIREWICLNDSWLAQIRKWVGNNTSKDEIKHDLLQGGISEELVTKILVCITLRKNDIKHSLIQQTSSIARASLKNFDWKVKLVMSSDKLANIREPLVDLRFELQAEDQTGSFSVELDKEELKLVIDKLEAANKAVLQLRS
eukprot:gene7442-8264_t